MSRLIDADALPEHKFPTIDGYYAMGWNCAIEAICENEPSIDIVRCEECRKSHIDGKTTHYLWCTEWGRSTDTFGYCERGEREGE